MSFFDNRYGYSATYFTAVLSSLRVSSSSYDHTFDLTPSVGSGTFQIQDYAVTPQTYSAPFYSNSYRAAGVSNYRVVDVLASDTIGSKYNDFRAYRSLGQANGTSILGDQYASAYTYDRDANTGAFDRYAYTNSNVNFSPDPTAVTAVPTPALLPGMMAFGLGVWRKRKQVKQVEA